MINISRLMLAVFIISLPGVSDAAAAAALNARVTVVKTGQPAIQIPNKSASPANLLPHLTLTSPKLQPALKPGSELVVPNAKVSLDLAVEQTVQAELSEMSADEAKVQASLTFDKAQKGGEQGGAVDTGAYAAGGSQTLEKPSAVSTSKAKASPSAPSSKKKAGPQGWGRKGKLAAAALMTAGAAGIAYALSLAGLPEAAAGLIPFLGFAGTLGDEGSSGRGLPDATAQQFYQLLAKNVKPGGLITEALQSQTAQALGLSEAAKDAAMLKLTEQNRVAAFTNGTFIYTDLHRRAASKNDDPGLAEADQHGFMGLKLVNSANFFDKLRGIHFLNEAQKAYAANPHPNRQLGVIKNNAYMEVAKDILRAHHKVQSGNEKTLHVKQVLQQLEAAIQWASGTVFAVGRATPEMIEAHDRDFLIRMIRGLSESSYGDNENYDEISDGVQLLENFIEGFGPEPVEGGSGSPYKQLTGPQNLGTNGQRVNPAGTGKNFPLIRKGDARAKALYAFGENLSARAVDSRMTPLIGRKEEIRQAVKILRMVDENNPVFLGESGVGKTKLGEGLAQAIVNGDFPQLAGVNIFKLDLTMLAAGAKHKGEYEERLQAVMNEVKASDGKIILFIDELHRIVNPADGSNDAAAILKESLAGSKLSVVGATTLSDYKKIEKDPALKRRFHPVIVKAPTKEEAVQIAMGVKYVYEEKHNVTIDEATVRSAVEFATRYITDRQLPGSVLKLLDMAGSELELQAGRADRAVTVQDLAFEISVRTGIPAGQLGADDLALLQSLPDELKKRLIGQDHAIEKIVRAIRRGRLGYRDPKKPVGAFALLGPTGVGKTHLVRVIARFLFRSEKSMVRIDMSEYKEKHNISRLIGAPPGYIGFEGDGEFEKVRRNPHSAVLFDEIDKAHPEVLDLLLQILDDGFITDSQGRKIDFSHTLIFLTANTGGSLGASATGGKPRRIGFITAEEERKERKPTGSELDARDQGYVDAFKGATRPEFFNRVGKNNVIVFHDLDRVDLAQILEIGIGELNDRIKHKEMTVELSDGAKSRLLDEAASEENRQYGARPLGQALENDVESALVDAELAREIANGDAVIVEVVGSKFIAKKKAK